MKPVQHPANILLVDDSELNVMVLNGILEAQGYRVRIASEGPEALKIIEENAPDIILLDILMPDMDGFEICERIKSDERTRQIPIIFLSALQDLSQKTKAFAAGAVDYITKPFQTKEVQSRIETHLALRRLQKELEQKNKELQKEIRVHERDKAELRQYRDHLEDLVEKRTQKLQREIADRKQTERALLESQKEWERTFNTIPDLISIIDKNHHLVRVNKAMRDRLQMAPEDLLSHPCYHLIHGTNQPPISCPYSALLKDEHKRTTELYEECLQGHFMLSVTPFYQSNGELAGCVHVLHDITERKKAEEALQESEERFRSTFEQAAVGIAHAALDGSFIRINHRFCDILGYEHNELMQCSFKDVTHAKDLDEHLHSFQELLDDRRQITSFEKRCLRKDGSSVWVNLTMSLLRDTSGRPKYFMSVIEDISSRKEAETERQRLETQLRQTQRLEALGTLAGGIAHDFNNILGTMQGYTEFLLTKLSSDSKEKIYLERIFQAGKRATELVRRILTFSRAHEHQLVPTYIAPLVKETLEMLRATIPANITIHHSIQDDCRPVMADSAQIHQMLMNLCINAKQAMQEHGGALELSLREITLPNPQYEFAPQLTEGHYLELTVGDSGSGMTEAVKERIFDPFFTTRATSGGTGLGLSVVHGIAKGHGGEICVESEPQQGTVFHIFFPMASSISMPQDLSAPQEPERFMHTQAPAFPHSTRHILLVDDERDLIELYRMRFSAQGYQVSTCHDGMEALQLFQTRPEDFDLVFTDQNMPEMSGEQLIQELLAIREDLPIILATGYSDDLTEAKALSLGVRRFLMKPVDTRELLAVVHNILEES